MRDAFVQKTYSMYPPSTTTECTMFTSSRSTKRGAAPFSMLCYVRKQDGQLMLFKAVCQRALQRERRANQAICFSH